MQTLGIIIFSIGIVVWILLLVGVICGNNLSKINQIIAICYVIGVFINWLCDLIK